MNNEAKAQLNYLRVGPRKIRLLADLIRGLSVQEAGIQLQMEKKHAATPLLKLLKSAVANAVHNHNLIEESLVVKSIMVNNGPILHRWMPRAMGRATPIRKRTSHITLILAGDENKKRNEKAEKTEEIVDDKEVKSETEKKVKKTKKEKIETKKKTKAKIKK